MEISRIKIEAFCSTCHKFVPFKVNEGDPKVAYRLATISGEHISSASTEALPPIILCKNGTRHTFNMECSKATPA